MLALAVACVGAFEVSAWVKLTMEVHMRLHVDLMCVVKQAAVWGPQD